ncbi:MAG: ABC transporter ATP-binding protein [Verrucomicrobiota bacterium]
MNQFIKNLSAFAMPYRFRLGLGVLLGVLAGFMEPLAIAVATGIYHLIFSPESSSVQKQLRALPAWVSDRIPQSVWEWLDAAQQALVSDLKTQPAAVILLVALIPAVMFLRGLFTYLNNYFLQWAAIRAITDLRVKLFAHLMKLPAGFFSGTNTGELMSRIMNDTAALQNILGNSMATIVKDPATLLGLVIYLMLTAPKLTAISMVVMPLCVIPIVIYGRKARRSAGKLQTQFAELSNVMTEAFTGNRIIRAFNLEQLVTEQFRAAAGRVVGLYMRILRAMETPGPLMETFGAVGVALVFLYLAAQGRNHLNYADFGGVLLAMFAMYRPIKQLARLQNTFLQAQASSRRVFELLALKSTISEPSAPKPLHAAGADVHFDNLEFAYGEKTVLRGVDLTVKAGQLVALVGTTGSGKTTLTNLLLRFYDPQQGAVRIGGTDIREFATHDLRNQIAVVTQDTVLFNDTIRRNIELGRPGASEADIIAAAKHAHAHEFITEKPEGYNTVVGEKGVLLSGGQKQRLAIARAVVRNAPILILDEATSALDTESERAVQAALEELMQGRTTLCIAHRLSTIQRADVIVVLDQGRIVETGQHGELVRRGGIYQKLYDLQFNT